MFTAALQNVQGDLFFVDAFPDGPTRTKFNRDAIYKAAIGLNEKEIAERASKDVWFVTHLSNVVRTHISFINYIANNFCQLAPRISILRSDIRKIAVAGIAGAFTLTTAEDIAELLKLDSYIYPREVCTLPLLLLAIADVLCRPTRSKIIAHTAIRLFNTLSRLKCLRVDSPSTSTTATVSPKPQLLELSLSTSRRR